MRSHYILKPILLLFLAFCCFQTAFSQCSQPDGVIFVTNTNDEGPGSLREAINCANATAGVNIIRFNIPGLQDQEIFVGATTGLPLPVLSDAETIIDGTTQPGHGFAGDFSPKVLLDGSAVDWDIPINGLLITGDNCEIYGLEILNFPDDGIEVFDANGVQIGDSEKMNIIYQCGSETDFFDGAPGSGPWEGSGIHVRQNANSCLIRNNIIGTDEDEETGMGNEYCGIRFESGSLNGTIGPGNLISGNLIGIRISGSYGVEISRNEIYCNLEEGIEITENANFDKAMPAITTALPELVAGTGTNGDVVEVYRSNNLDCFPNPVPCQGRIFLGSVTVSGGQWSLPAPFADGEILKNGYQITAISTDFLDNSSEFAPCATVIDTANCANANGVVKVIDSKDAGEGTLRSAILCANAVPGPNTVEFTIQGAGPHIIYVGSATRRALPALVDPGTILDASTQPLHGLNDNFKPQVILDGSLHNWQLPENALFIQADHTEVYALEVRNFPDDGIDVTGADSCIIGAPQKGNTVYNCGSPLDTFPGLPDVGPWNGSGIVLKGGATNCMVQGNTVGTDYLQSVDGGNEFAGIIIRNGGGHHRIGGDQPGEANIIRYNASGIHLASDVSQVDISRNQLMCNDTAGIFLAGMANMQKAAPVIDSATNLLITGTAAAGDRVEIFKQLKDDCPAAACQGSLFLAEATADAAGNWSVAFPFQDSILLLQGDQITATATSADGNSSAYSPCREVEQQCNLQLTDIAIVADTCLSGIGSISVNAVGGFLPLEYSLSGDTDPEGQFEMLEGGKNYQLIVSEALGCTRMEVIELPSIGDFTQANFGYSFQDLEFSFEDNSFFADSLYWTFGDSTESVEIAPIHTFDSTGLYEVCQYTFGDCNRDTLCKAVAVFAAQDRLDFLIGEGSGLPGDTIRVPLRVRGFRQMLGFQFSLHLDDPMAHMVGVTGMNLSGLNASSFLLQDSLLNCSWSDNTLAGIDLPDSTILFEIEIVLDAPFLDCALLFENGVPTPAETIRYLEGVTVKSSFRFFDGQVCAERAFAGAIRRENGDPVGGVSVFVNGNNPDTTAMDGLYEARYRAAEGFPSVIDPQKNYNVGNGITTFDMVRIQQHLLFITLLDSPYKIIAADVDNSQNVSTFDLTLMRLLILGLASDFPNNESWRFVPESYSFMNPQTPLQENFPEEIVLNNPSDLDGNLNFIGIKTGDVTLDANPNTLLEGEPVLLPGKMELLDEEGNFRLLVSAESASLLASLQTTLAVDPARIRLDAVEVLNPDIQLNDQLLAEGRLPFLWLPASGQAEALSREMPLLLLQGQLLQDSALPEEAFSTGNLPTPSMAFSPEGTPRPILWQLMESVTGIPAQPSTEEGMKAVLFPNPMHSSTTLQFELPEPGDCRIILYDSQGEQLMVWEMKGVAGSQQLELSREKLPLPGIYWIHLISSTSEQTLRLIRQ
jgi:hypothetical protein